MSTRPLRIGLFLVAFPRRSETFIVTKVLKMLDAGIDVHLFTLSAGADWDSFEILNGRDDIRARIHLVPPLRPRSAVATRGLFEVAATAVRHPAAFARYALHTWKHRDELPTSVPKALYEHLRFVGQKLDILHIEFDYQSLGIADLKEYLGCKLLVSGRGTFQSSSTYAQVNDAPGYLFRYIDGYHFISAFLEEHMRGLGLPDSIPRWRIEPAIDLQLFGPRGRERENGPLRVVSVGRLDWTKGYEFAIDAIAQLHRRGVVVRYEIHGAGPYEAAVRFAIQQQGVEKIVTLAGARNREEMPDVYARADVLLHAALDEGFCNAVIEAQAMGLPVVTSDAGGLPENVENGVTGFVVPRRNAAALADKLELLAGDSALRSRLGTAGRRRAETRFDLDRQADAFVQMYRELASLPHR